MDIQTIIDDIISLDPSLASRRGELETIVLAMIAQKPDIAVDDLFLSQLRRQLETVTAAESDQTIHSFFEFFVQHRVAYGGIFASVVFGLVMYTFVLQRPQEISLATKNGFGSFAVAQLPKYEALSAQEMDTASTIVSTGMVETSFSTESGRGSNSDMAKMMIYPPDGGEYGQYQFVVPDLTDELEASMPVYGYVPNSSISRGVDRALAEVWAEIFREKSSRFRGQHVSGIVEIDGGMYSVFIDGQRAVVQISFVYPPCTGRDCDEMYRPLSPNEQIEEGQIIGIADSFLDELGVERDSFGDPRVVSPLVYTIMNEFGTSMESIADTVDVLYPLVLADDVTIVDSAGISTIGLRVSVSIRRQEVMSISEIPLSTLAASAYDVVTDVERISALAELGGQYGVWGALTYGASFELSQPRLVYTAIWKSDDTGFGGNTLYVPAYQFDIVYPSSVHDRDYLQQSLIIPLEKDLFEQAERDAKQRVDGGYPTPMPFVRTIDVGVSEGSEGQGSEGAPAVESSVEPTIVE